MQESYCFNLLEILIFAGDLCMQTMYYYLSNVIRNSKLIFRKACLLEHVMMYILQCTGLVRNNSHFSIIVSLRIITMFIQPHAFFCKDQ